MIPAYYEPPANTVDTLKAGDPNTAVTGIVTTFMDTHSGPASPFRLSIPLRIGSADRPG